MTEGSQQMGFEDWMASLDEQDRATLMPVWDDHKAKFNANQTYTPQSDEFSAMWNRYMADTTI